MIDEKRPNVHRSLMYPHEKVCKSEIINTLRLELANVHSSMVPSYRKRVDWSVLAFSSSEELSAVLTKEPANMVYWKVFQCMLRVEAQRYESLSHLFNTRADISAPYLYLSRALTLVSALEFPDALHMPLYVHGVYKGRQPAPSKEEDL